MSDTTKVNQLINLFSSNAAGVLSTITNNTLEINPLTTEPFDFTRVESEFELPGVILTINFTGDQNFQVSILLDKKLVAILSDLMMLGDGEVDYFPEEHNDAIQEMFNQVLGSLASELSGMDISLTGTVSQVELTDMEIQKDFLEDNIMSRLHMEILEKEFFIDMFLDDFAQTSINNLFQDSGGKQAPAQAAPQPSSPKQAAYNPAQDMPQQPMASVSRAQFSEVDDRGDRPIGNENIDILYDIVLPITVQLGRKDMKIKEILEIGQGSVIELDKTAGDYVDLIVNGKKFAIGEVMVADENYAVRIVSLVSRKERIKHLGNV